MRLTAAALWSTGESVAETCAARRGGSQNSKSNLSDLSYSYERRGDVIEVTSMCVRCQCGRRRGEAPTLGRIRVSRSRLERGGVCRGGRPRLVAMNLLLLVCRARYYRENEDRLRNLGVWQGLMDHTPTRGLFNRHQSCPALYFEKRPENGEREGNNSPSCALRLPYPSVQEWRWIYCTWEEQVTV